MSASDTNFASYQTAETAWRYEAIKSELSTRIKAHEIALGDLRRQLGELEAKPPMRELFNWSA